MGRLGVGLLDPKLSVRSARGRFRCRRGGRRSASRGRGPPAWLASCRAAPRGPRRSSARSTNTMPWCSRFSVSAAKNRAAVISSAAGGGRGSPTPDRRRTLGPASGRWPAGPSGGGANLGHGGICPLEALAAACVTVVVGTGERICSGAASSVGSRNVSDRPPRDRRARTPGQGRVTGARHRLHRRQKDAALLAGRRPAGRPHAEILLAPTPTTSPGPRPAVSRADGGRPASPHRRPHRGDGRRAAPGGRRCPTRSARCSTAGSGPNGLRIARVRVPLGVVAIIYENRPNVTSDAAGLCLKSGNAAFLRGLVGRHHARTSPSPPCCARRYAKAGLPDRRARAGGGHQPRGGRRVHAAARARSTASSRAAARR